MKIKNNGQVLVLFAIILPIILLTLITLIELGKIYVEKSKTANIIKETITYGLKNYNEEIETKLNNLINININNIEEKSIFISEDEIRINLKQKSIKIFGINIKLEYNYKGIKQEETIMIEEG